MDDLIGSASQHRSAASTSPCALSLTPLPSRSTALYAGQVSNGVQLFLRWCFGVDDAEGAVRLAQAVQFVAHQQPAVLDDADGVGDGFYVGEEVGGEEDGPSFSGHVADEDFEEGAAGHRVESRGGLVQEQGPRDRSQARDRTGAAPSVPWRAF